MISLLPNYTNLPRIFFIPCRLCNLHSRADLCNYRKRENCSFHTHTVEMNTQRNMAEEDEVRAPRHDATRTWHQWFSKNMGKIGKHHFIFILFYSLSTTLRDKLTCIKEGEVVPVASNIWRKLLSLILWYLLRSILLKNLGYVYSCLVNATALAECSRRCFSRCQYWMKIQENRKQ